jgi:hypothetical protein
MRLLPEHFGRDQGDAALADMEALAVLLAS